MPDMNTVTLSGNLTGDPELRKAGQTDLATFSVAHNKRKFNRDTKKWEDGESYFFDVQAWGKDALRAGSLSKGQRVVVMGALRQDRWEKDGQKRQKVLINANSLMVEVPESASPQEDGDVNW